MLCSVYSIYIANILCYADDILILAPSASGLQAILDDIGNIMNNLCLKINTQKSVYIMLKNCSKAEYQCNVSILGIILKQENQIRYLGIIILLLYHYYYIISL